MNEFLSEREQLEVFRQWWRENGWYLVGGAGVALLGYFGWNQYQAREQAVAEQRRRSTSNFSKPSRTTVRKPNRFSLNSRRTIRTVPTRIRAAC